jgi:hypothetical protein
MNAEDLLYPRSRFQVLRILNQADAPVSLSVIADRANLVIGSVQQAVSWLMQEKVLSVQRESNRTCYKIRSEAAKEIVSKITEVLEAIEITQRAKQFQFRARNLLEDLDDRRCMNSHAKRVMKK